MGRQMSDDHERMNHLETVASAAVESARKIDEAIRRSGLSLTVCDRCKLPTVVPGVCCDCCAEAGETFELTVQIKRANG